MRYLLVLLLLLSACGPIPVYIDKNDSKSKSDVDTSASQGASTIPIIIICNQTTIGKAGGNSPCMEIHRGKVLHDIMDSEANKIIERK
jgi:hypothetical protein